MSQFEARKLEGDSGEERVAQSFLAAGWFVQKKFAHFRRDLALISPAGVVELLEVKNEDNFATSPNLCLELMQKLKQFSGLAISESTACVHTFGAECIVYRTQKMRLHIEMKLCDGDYAYRMFEGSDNNNGGVLVPKRDVLMKPWAEQIPIARLPHSRVLRN